MTTPTLSDRSRQLSPAREAKRRLFMRVLGVVPFAVKLWIARNIAPNLVRYLPAGHSVVIPDYAGRYRVRLSTDFPIETMMIVGRYEVVTRLVVERLVQPGDQCIDVGANIGGITFLIVARAGDAGRVLAFEPAPSTFARLRYNVELNPELNGRLVPVQAGLGERPGDLQLVEDHATPGNASLHAVGGVVVPVTTLDAAIVKHGLSRLDFMKIDVEGMEYEVLCGAKATLEAWRPTMYFETMVENDRARGTPAFALIEDLLLPMDYRLFDVKGHGSLVPATRAGYGANTLAVPASRVEMVRRALARVGGVVERGDGLAERSDLSRLL